MFPSRKDNDHPTSAPMGLFRAADGWLNIGVSGEGQWRDFCRAIERPDWLERDEFRLNADRIRHRTEINDAVQALFAQDSVAHWVALLNRAEHPGGAGVHRARDVRRRAGAAPASARARFARPRET